MGAPTGELGGDHSNINSSSEVGEADFEWPGRNANGPHKVEDSPDSSDDEDENNVSSELNSDMNSNSGSETESGLDASEEEEEEEDDEEKEKEEKLMEAVQGQNKDTRSGENESNFVASSDGNNGSTDNVDMPSVSVPESQEGFVKESN